MKTIKINAKGAGKWADPDTNVPQIVVEEGDEVTVSNALADMMLPNCGKDITADLAKIADEDAATQKEKDAVAEITGRIAELVAEGDGDLGALELDGKSSSELTAIEDDLLLAKKATAEAEEGKIAELKAQAEALISAMELDVANYNLAGDSEVLAELVAKLTEEQEAKAEADKKKKTPATKDKKTAESK